MNSRKPFSRYAVFSLLVVLVVSLPVFAQDVPLRNWKPSIGHISASSDLNIGSAFQAVSPCRVVDTRGATGAFGGPFFSAGQTRSYNIPAGPCAGIPNAAAYSLNFTIVNYDPTLGPNGFVTAWQNGVARPTVSTVNFGNGSNAVANAAVVPASSGTIQVYSSGATHLIIDINGYYPGLGNMNANQFVGVYGSYNGGGLLYSNNNDAGTSQYTSAVRGWVPSASGGQGVLGENWATGKNAGVRGERTADPTLSANLNSAGVLGVNAGRSASNSTYYGSGVRGESAAGNGVVGVTDGFGDGVIGENFDATAGSYRTAGRLGGRTYGVYSQGPTAATGTKSFVDPHPTDPTKVIRFVSLEGNEAGTYFRGKGHFEGGRAVIDVPEEFRDVTEAEGLTVHITPMGRIASVGVINADLNTIEVEATRDVDFSYIVYGVRRGYSDFHSIGQGDEFAPASESERIPGYLNAVQRQRLIDNGTYNADGTVNLSTAIKAGWKAAWDKRTVSSATSATKDPQNKSEAVVLFDGKEP